MTYAASPRYEAARAARSGEADFYMTQFVAGIDTGGTSTDAVIVEAGSQRLVAKFKALTTRGDLSVGVGEALAGALHAAQGVARASDIRLVSLSTTLATNAIVEGHGAPVGIVLIGFDDAMTARTGIAAAMPTVRIASLAGGHDHGGGEAAAFDAAGLEAFLRAEDVGLEAYAIASHYSVRNPAHEQAARDIVRRLTSKPVSLSSDLAQALDAPRRALTAALNARIIGRIAALIGAVRAAMARLAIDAPLMIVKGDGSLAPADYAAQRPVETILSGPAASVVGARFLSGLDDFIVADIGGTTTDIAVVENGQPRLRRDGAEAGGFRTMARAIDMRSYGLGGDSEVDVDAHGAVSLGARRVVPLALLAARFPAVEATLAAQLESPDPPGYPGRFVLAPFASAGAAPGVSASDADFLQRIAAGPVPLGDLARMPSQLRVIERLVKAGALQLAGFTPSDAAHILRAQSQWSRSAARLGGALLLRWRLIRRARPGDDAPVEALARDVFEAVTQKSARLLIAALAGNGAVAASPFADAAARGAPLGRLAVSLKPQLPLIGVGGPAPVFFPALAERLGCALVLPQNGDAANAIGAAVGLARARAVVEVTSGSSDGWRVHDGGAPIVFESPGAALAHADARARALAAAQLAALGGRNGADIHVEIERSDIPGMPGDQGLVGAMLVAECRSKIAQRGDAA